MTLLKRRLERMENELRFQEWLSIQRILDTWTDDQIENYASEGRLPENPFNRACPLYRSLEGMDRNAVMKVWEAEERSLRSQGLNKSLTSS